MLRIGLPLLLFSAIAHAQVKLPKPAKPDNYALIQKLDFDSVISKRCGPWAGSERAPKDTCYVDAIYVKQSADPSNDAPPPPPPPPPFNDPKWTRRYDEQKRLTYAGEDSTSTNSAFAKYEYDPQGRMSRMVKNNKWDGHMDTRYRYDDAGRLLSQSGSYNGGRSVDSTSYTYEKDRLVLEERFFKMKDAAFSKVGTVQYIYRQDGLLEKEVSTAGKHDVISPWTETRTYFYFKRKK